MNRVVVIALVLLMGGCVTRMPANDRSYVSITDQPYEREGCSPVRPAVQQTSWVSSMTRDRLPRRIALIPVRTYAYGTQSPLQRRPTPNQPLCLVLVREKSSWQGSTELLVGLEAEVIDDQTIRLNVTRIRLDASALWKARPPQINASLDFGLVDDSGTAPELFSHGSINLASIPLGEDWRIAWQDRSPTETRSTMLYWPVDRQNIRLVAVVGERRYGRARADPDLLSLQVSTRARDSLDWYPAR